MRSWGRSVFFLGVVLQTRSFLPSGVLLTLKAQCFSFFFLFFSFFFMMPSEDNRCFFSPPGATAVGEENTSFRIHENVLASESFGQKAVCKIREILSHVFLGDKSFFNCCLILNRDLSHWKTYDIYDYPPL